MELGDNSLVSAILGGEKLDAQGGEQQEQHQEHQEQHQEQQQEEEIKPYNDEHGTYNFGKVFGKDYSDPSRIKPIIEKAAKIPEYENELNTLRPLKSQYESQIAELSKKPIYRNPLYYKLEKISEESPDELPLFQSFALNTLDDFDLIKADLKRKYPDLAKSEENLQMMMENEFGSTIFEQDADETSKEYQAAAIKLKMRATDLRNNIQSRLDKIEVPDREKMMAADKEAMTALVTKWKEPFGKIAQNFSKLAVTVPDEKDPKKMVELLSIDIPESERGEYYEIASQYIASNKLSPDEGGAEKVATLIQDMYFLRHRSQIFAKIAEDASKVEGGKWRSLIHNTGRKNNAPGEHQNVGADVSTQLMDKLRTDGQL
jgi:hypothetical protein